MFSRRKFLAAGVGGLAVGAGLGMGDVLSLVTKTHKNVLMLIVDDLNDWIGAMGGHPNSKTPNIDRLARQGTVFANAHAPAPLCGPSRASVMTGLLPSSTGIYAQVRDKDIKSANEVAAQSVFLSEYFAANGYHTIGIGKIFHQGAPENSFHEYGGRAPRFGPYPPQPLKWHKKGTSTDWGPYPESDDMMPDYRSAHWTADRLGQDQGKPFFMACGFLRPHVPWHVPRKWFDLHPLDNIVEPAYLPSDLMDVPEIARRVAEMPMMPTTEWAKENGEWRAIIQAYLASVSFVDSCVGIVLNALEQSAYAKDTIVVLWGDHGYHLGEKNRFAKQALWERATRAPLIIASPDGPGGRVNTRPVSLVDLYPTLIDLCGLPANDSNQGNSLAPLLKAGEMSWPHAALTTYGPNNHAVRTDQYRYIRYEDGSEELYDHYSDDAEWNNLANDPAFAHVKKELKGYLPLRNEKWSPVTYYEVNDYFREKSKNSNRAKGRKLRRR